MKLIQDFFNKVASELDKTYFPTVKFYRDSEDCAKVHYNLELFSNGCLTYTELISRLSLRCNDTKLNIHAIVSKYVTDFNGYIYSSK